MNYKDFLIPFSSVDLPELYKDWLWLITPENLSKALAMTSFGDLFFMHESGKIYFLNTTEGTARSCAQTYSGARSLMASRDGLTDYLLSNLVLEMREQDLALSKGELYSFKVYPSAPELGKVGNIQILPIKTALSVSGQRQKQMKQG